MREIVKEKLSEIRRLYPESRIQQSKMRWTRLWTDEKQIDRSPFVCVPPLFDPYEPLHTKEERLMASLDEIIIRGHMNDDYIPSLFCGCRTTTIPNMFGAVEKIVGREVACDKIINEPEEIDKLVKANMGDGTVAKMWLEMMEFFLDETAGELPVHVVDMQGPVDASAQMFGYENLFLCTYDDPVRYHNLLELVTDGYISFWKKQMDLLGDNFIGTHLFAWDWLPKGMGASMSIDSLVMSSPDFYEEFYKPYTEKISDTFGGVITHSCGDFRSVIPNLNKTRGLRAVNASQLSLKQLLDAGIDNSKIAILFVDYPALDELIANALAADLRVSMSVTGIWPGQEGFIRSKPFATWQEDDFKTMKIMEETIIAKLGDLK
jgi:hypothetical protein